MRNMKLIIVGFVVVLLTACGGVVNVTKPYQAESSDMFNYKINYLDGVVVTDAALDVLKPYLETQLSEQGKLAQEGVQNAKTIDITFNHYRMRHGAARHLAGAFAGADTIDTTVLVKDNNGEILGETQVKSTNASAWGSATSLIQGHVDKIVEFINSGN